MKKRMSPEEAWAWYDSHGWIMGCNYVPSCMPGVSLWQEDTMEEALETVIPELDLLQKTGFNSVRMMWPFALWYHEREKCLDRIDRVLELLAARGIGCMPILYNDCVNFGRPANIAVGYPKGKQKFDWGHHGGYADSPFIVEDIRRGWIYWDEEEYRGVMEDYLHAVFSRFGHDERIDIWDMWNEPGNSRRGGMSIPYLARSFEIARSHDPIAPLTAGVWEYPADYGIDPAAQISEIARLSIDLSDIISFHEYENFERVQAVVRMLEREKRPMANTEWLHRIFDNFVEDNLPFYYDKKIMSYHWGLVAGNSQHYLPWDNIRGNPALDYTRWQHDIYRQDHTPYSQKEIDLFMKYGSARSSAGKKVVR